MLRKTILPWVTERQNNSGPRNHGLEPGRQTELFAKPPWHRLSTGTAHRGPGRAALQGLPRLLTNPHTANDKSYTFYSSENQKGKQPKL